MEILIAHLDTKMGVIYYRVNGIFCFLTLDENDVDLLKEDFDRSESCIIVRDRHVNFGAKLTAELALDLNTPLHVLELAEKQLS